MKNTSYLLMNLMLFMLSFNTSYAKSPVIRIPEIEGIWLGEMQVTEKMSLHIGFEIKTDSAGKMVALMHVVEQNAFDIPMDSINILDNKLFITLKEAGIVYSGIYIPESLIIIGNYNQGGGSFELNLTRTDKIEREVHRSQTPVRPFPYLEEEVSFENKQGKVKLAGTLTLPNSPGTFPAVILIHGSGHNDRNGTTMGHFLLLSDYLTRQGFAVLRYDKRGVDASSGEYDQATTFDFASDVMAGIEFLQNRTDINPLKIGLIGHSEGAMIAPIIASGNGKSKVAFIVMMGGVGVSGEELLLEQSKNIATLNGVPALDIKKQIEIQKQQYGIIKSKLDNEFKFKKIKEVDPQISESMINVLIKPWFQSFIKIEMSIYLEKIKCPVLALTGEKDVQCSPVQNLPRMRESLAKGGNKNVEIHELKGLNHLFQTANSGLPYEYETIEEIIAPKALELVSNWITGILKY